MKQYSCAQNLVATVPVSYSWQILNQSLDEEEAEKASSFYKAATNEKHHTPTLLIIVMVDCQV